MATKAASKAKTTAKKTAKAPIKKTVMKTPAKMTAKTAKPKLKAPVRKKVEAKAKPMMSVVKPTKKTAHKPQKPVHESVFARLLREKAERHEKYQQQNQGPSHQDHDANRMPHNHASFSKFAGPRRRAS